MLIDDVTIDIRAGNGGHGRVSFKRNAQTAKGGPDGGNGGNGGDLFFQGVDDVSALSQFAYIKSMAAEDGVAGGKQNLFGRNGEDKTVFVPLGTIITDLDSNEEFEITSLIDKLLLAKGGKGGRGNNEFKSATIQAPKYRELGEDGQRRKLKLVLKLIADIGLIGLPNAGKSSLLEVLTNAKPKIGNYPFTTLEPNLGVMDGLILADIPGLIEGASNGRGLGDKFLRHVERTKVLVHCVDSSSNYILKDYQIIRNELASFNKILNEKKEILVLTKTDLLTQDELKEKIKIAKKINKNFLQVSIYNEDSIVSLKKNLVSLI